MGEFIGTKCQLVGKGAQHLGHMDRAAAGGHPDQCELMHGPDEIQHGEADNDRSQLR